MLEILQFIFSSFWVFLGTVILLGIIAKYGVALILGAIVAAKGGSVNIE